MVHPYLVKSVETYSKTVFHIPETKACWKIIPLTRPSCPWPDQSRLSSWWHVTEALNEIISDYSISKTKNLAKIHPPPSTLVSIFTKLPKNTFDKLSTK